MAKKRIKKKKFNYVALIGFLMLGTLLFGTIAFVLMDSSNNLDNEKYNDFKLFNNGQFWVLNYNNKDINFLYFPSSIDYINISKNAINIINNTEYIFFSFDPNDKYINNLELIRMEFEKEMNFNFNKNIISSILNNNSVVYSFPVIDCNNATQNVPVIIFKSGNQTGFDYENNCIIATTNQGNFRLLKERLIYGLIGVIN
jgi:hypothetical protein